MFKLALISMQKVIQPSPKTRTIFHRINAISLKTGVGYFKSLSEHFQEDYIYMVPVFTTNVSSQLQTTSFPGRGYKRQLFTRPLFTKRKRGYKKLSDDKASFCSYLATSKLLVVKKKHLLGAKSKVTLVGWKKK